MIHQGDHWDWDVACMFQEREKDSLVSARAQAETHYRLVTKSLLRRWCLSRWGTIFNLAVISFRNFYTSYASAIIISLPVVLIKISQWHDTILRYFYLSENYCDLLYSCVLELPFQLPNHHDLPKLWPRPSHQSYPRLTIMIQIKVIRTIQSTMTTFLFTRMTVGCKTYSIREICVYFFSELFLKHLFIFSW